MRSAHPFCYAKTYVVSDYVGPFVVCFVLLRLCDNGRVFVFVFLHRRFCVHATVSYIGWGGGGGKGVGWCFINKREMKRIIKKQANEITQIETRSRKIIIIVSNHIIIHCILISREDLCGVSEFLDWFSAGHSLYLSLSFFLARGSCSFPLVRVFVLGAKRFADRVTKSNISVFVCVRILPSNMYKKYVQSLIEYLINYTYYNLYLQRVCRTFPPHLIHRSSSHARHSLSLSLAHTFPFDRRERRVDSSMCSYFSVACRSFWGGGGDWWRGSHRQWDGWCLLAFDCMSLVWRSSFAWMRKCGVQNWKETLHHEHDEQRSAAAHCKRYDRAKHTPRDNRTTPPDINERPQNTSNSFFLHFHMF